MILGDGIQNAMIDCGLGVHMPKDVNAIQELPTLDGTELWISECLYCLKPILGVALDPPRDRWEEVLHVLLSGRAWLSDPPAFVIEEHP